MSGHFGDGTLGKIESFSAYESLTDFDSFIGLTRENLTQKFVRSILARARAKFHKNKDHSCLLYADNFLSRLRDEFKDKLEKPQPTDDSLSWLLRPNPPSWDAIGDEKCWITRPQFLRVEDDSIYHWSSRVTFVRLYRKSLSAFAQLGGLPSTPERRLLVLGIDVEWQANVRADGRFFETKVIGKKEAEYSFTPPTEEQLQRYGVEQFAGGQLPTAGESNAT